jgi:hypothetical protein
MMRGMKHRLIMLCGSLLVLMVPLVALAAPQEQEREILEARLEGYPQVVALEGGSTAFTWILLIVLTLLAIGALFKDAKRTHLD